MTETWEYFTTFVEANLFQNRERLAAMDVDTKGMKSCAPESLMVPLNDLGLKGWELVHMQPVVVGGNSDIAGFYGAGVSPAKVWTHDYFCVFKRRNPIP